MTVSLTQENYKAVADTVIERGGSVDSIVNDAVSQYMENIREDVEDIADTKRICDAIDSGQMETYPLEDVKRELGL